LSGRSLRLENVRIVEPGRQVRVGDVLARDGKIAAFGKVAPELAPDAVAIAGNGRLLTPGLIDVHTHGILSHAYEAGPEAFRRAGQSLAQFGVTTVVPTIVPQLKPGWQQRLAAIAKVIPSIEEVHIPGLHLEGPFVAIPGAACATIAGDLALLEELLAACAQRVAVMSVSPDTAKVLPVIARLRESKIAVFLTHTRATVEQTEAALAAGATHATHFYDVFYPPAETDPGVRPVGIVEAMLADRRATVDFIADGVHVHPTAIRLAVAAKGFGGVVLITDSNVGAGLPAGVYDTPHGFQVRIKEGDAARHATEGFLAGSALTMNRGIANLLRWLDLPPAQIWAMGTSNPARVLGLANKGRIEVGADADLVLWEEDLRPAFTWVNGKCVYENKAR
jgi:N-acetylglucosamine-6-phosphate deacetylase